MHDSAQVQLKEFVNKAGKELSKSDFKGMLLKERDGGEAVVDLILAALSSH